MGGNVFKNEECVPVKREDVVGIVDEFMECLTYEFFGEKGSPIASYAVVGGFLTGKEVLSDIDIAINVMDPILDRYGMSDAEIRKSIFEYCEPIFGTQNVKKTGRNVHVLFSPKLGEPIQVDLMYSKVPRDDEWILRGFPRHMLLSFIAKKCSESHSSLKFTLAAPGGIQLKMGDEVIIPRSSNPKRILTALDLQAEPDEMLTFNDVADVIYKSKYKENLVEFAEYVSQFASTEEFIAPLLYIRKLLNVGPYLKPTMEFKVWYEHDYSWRLAEVGHEEDAEPIMPTLNWDIDDEFLLRTIKEMYNLADITELGNVTIVR